MLSIDYASEGQVVTRPVAWVKCQCGIGKHVSGNDGEDITGAFKQTAEKLLGNWLAYHRRGDPVAGERCKLLSEDAK